ncbi:DUF4276 family protein [Marinospirillum sp.]|uniref:DUF4276 family protein n=1 Tax=Marinospirillum sp. TaxID=2183934 RepID=UPI0025B7FF57|nr:DUF4276 family protein [Marinospirillum sp.]
MVTIYLEGGGDAPQLKARCRKAFNKFIEKMGFKGKMPKLVACGSRRNAYERFCTAIAQNKKALLLVDSEAFVAKTHEFNAWLHVQQREGDSWTMPAQATPESCNLMVECMENWFLADIPALQAYYGAGFKPDKLPSISHGIEKVGKQQVYQGLKQATHSTRKGSYSKGDHSFAILEQINPDNVTAASEWAAKFKQRLQNAMGK